ncbi:MAG: molybdopterin-dependent oxidoreductase, partial [Thermodesulfobacteriota bacterium]|nr:molybdopterin-dependent oxidoreductase [Thermodesulfobacteriota bacterium]
MSEKTEIKKSVCTWCKGECGVLLHVKDGRLIKAEDDPDWPRKGFPPTKACPKFMAAIEWFYHPDRVNFPLKRAGERGEGKWNRISWDQAFTEIADKLIAVKDKYGAESIAFTRGTSYRTEANPINRFFLQLGSPMNSISAGNVCMVPRSSVAFCLVGMYPHYSVRPTTKCIVLLGAEPANARPITYNNMRKAIKNGAKLIIVDPRRTGSAVKSDIWLRLRPGTDTALLMSMVNVIIKEGLYDREFVEKWCHGFDKLVPWVEQFNPEEMAGITEVPAEKVREAARLYAATRPGAMVEGMGVEQQESCYRILHARWILAALTGNIDIEGGEELIGPNTKLMDNRSIPPVIPVDPELRKKQIGADRFKLLTFPGRQLITPHLKRVWGKVPELPLITQPSLIVRAILNSE